MLKDRILYEDNHLIAVNKLGGELVQGDVTGDKPLLEKVRDYIRETYNKPGNVFCGLIHRLDRPTSGIVLFGKTSKGLSRMNKLFENREVDKTYFAVVKVRPEAETQTLTHYLRKNREKNKSYAVPTSKKGAKEASLTYEWITASENYYLLKVKLHTGRHHQIRVQLAQEGMPIKGDLKYGFPRSNPDGNISLHAGWMEFVHPVKKEPIALKASCLSEDKVWSIFNKSIRA